MGLALSETVPLQHPKHSNRCSILFIPAGPVPPSCYLHITIFHTSLYIINIESNKCPRRSLCSLYSVCSLTLPSPLPSLPAPFPSGPHAYPGLSPFCPPPVAFVLLLFILNYYCSYIINGPKLSLPGNLTSSRQGEVAARHDQGRRQHWRTIKSGNVLGLLPQAMPWL